MALGELVEWALEGWPTLLGVARDVELEVLEEIYVNWVESVALEPTKSPMLCVEGPRVQLNAFAEDEDERGNIHGWQMVCFSTPNNGGMRRRAQLVREWEEDLEDGMGVIREILRERFELNDDEA